MAKGLASTGTCEERVEECTSLSGLKRIRCSCKMFTTEVLRLNKAHLPRHPRSSKQTLLWNFLRHSYPRPFSKSLTLDPASLFALRLYPNRHMKKDLVNAEISKRSALPRPSYIPRAASVREMRLGCHLNIHVLNHKRDGLDVDAGGEHIGRNKPIG